MTISYYMDHNKDSNKLRIEIRNKIVGERGSSIHECFLDNNPLVTTENAEIWAEYLQGKIDSLITESAMECDAYKKIADKIYKIRQDEADWKARQPEIRRREQHRKQLGRTPSLGFIPDGLTVDYEEEYGRYVDKAIKWMPEDTDDFLYQCRSLERMATKCVVRCIECKRPDAAYAQAMSVVKRIPEWLSRSDLKVYFDRYRLRLPKLIKASCKSLIDSAIAWNNQAKLNEANNFILSIATKYKDWGVRSKKMLELMSDAEITSEPIHIERKPNKAEQEQIRREQLRKKEEERHKAEKETELHSLIPLNEDFDKKVFSLSNIDWECRRIGSEVYNIGKRITRLIDTGKSHEAILTFLQLVKSMCRHFVADRHWTMFDDMYDPDIFCNDILRNIKKAYLDGKVPQQDIDFLQRAWKEIEATEARQSYGIAYYDKIF